MKKIMLALTLCASIVEFKSQNSFGIIEYSHTNSNLSDGKVTSINPGFITAGFETAVNTYNFTLDRMDAGGTPVETLMNFEKDTQFLLIIQRVVLLSPKLIMVQEYPS